MNNKENSIKVVIEEIKVPENLLDLIIENAFSKPLLSDQK